MKKFLYCALFLVAFLQIPVFSFSVQPEGTETTSNERAWENTLQNLLKTHGQLLNQINVAASSDQSKNDIDTIKKKLLSNAHNLADFFNLYVGKGAGNDFEPLFDDHIKFGGEYIEATKNHKPTDQIVKNALKNANQLADLFSKWFPSILDNQWQNMWSEHVKIEAKQTDAYFENDASLGLKLKDKSLAQLSQIGELMIQGIKSNLLKDAKKDR